MSCRSVLQALYDQLQKTKGNELTSLTVAELRDSLLNLARLVRENFLRNCTY